MYYTLSIGGIVRDVLASPLPTVYYNERSKMVLFCGENDTPSGVSSVHLGSFFHVDGWAAFPACVIAETATLAEVPKSTYDEEKRRLDLGNKGIEAVAAIAEKNQANIDYNIMMGNLEDPEEVLADE